MVYALNTGRGRMDRIGNDYVLRTKRYTFSAIPLNGLTVVFTIAISETGEVIQREHISIDSDLYNAFVDRTCKERNRLFDSVLTDLR